MATTDHLAADQPLLAFAASPTFSHDGACFAAGQGGLFKTTDHGETWTPILRDPTTHAPVPATAVAVSPSFVSDGIVFTAIPGGIGQSQNGGESWNFTALPLPPPVVSALTLSPAFSDDGITFAGTMEDGIYRTDDHGRSWLPWNFGLLDHSVLAVAVSSGFTRDGMVYAGTDSGLYRSTNRGRSWRPVETDATCPAILSLATIPSPAAPLHFAGTEEDGLMRLDPANNVLTRIADPALPETVHAISSVPSPVGYPTIVLIGDDRAVRSADGGNTWAPITNLPVSPEEITAVCPALETSDGPTVLLGTSAGMIHRIVLDDPG